MDIMHRKEYDGSKINSESAGSGLCGNGAVYGPTHLNDRWAQFLDTPTEENEKDFTKTQRLISEECASIRDMLLQKNKEYGDSAMNPLRIFASPGNVESINIRIDDKLSRIANQGEKNIKEDTVLDLIGYLILKRIAEKEEKD
jgi:hypothetical protein